jgi:hypothetical protein
MSYSNLKSQLQGQLEGQINSTEDYYKTYFNTDHTLKIKALTDRYIYHLYNDLAMLVTKHDLNSFLGKFYKNSDENAKECVQIAYLTKDIYGRNIRNWTDSALKSFDFILIKLINGLLGEKIPKPKGIPFETDVYEFLISKEGDLYEIGIAFQSIYQSRNSFTHVQIEESDGVRIPRQWSNKKYLREKELILDQFNKAINQLEIELSKYPF